MSTKSPLVDIMNFKLSRAQCSPPLCEEALEVGRGRPAVLSCNIQVTSGEKESSEARDKVVVSRIEIWEPPFSDANVEREIGPQENP